MNVYRRAASLMEAKIGDELVALDAESGHCFGFNSAATLVWNQLTRPQSFIELKQALLQEFEVTPQQCAAELQELVDDMLAKGLIEQL